MLIKSLSFIPSTGLVVHYFTLPLGYGHPAKLKVNFESINFKGISRFPALVAPTNSEQVKISIRCNSPV